MTAHPSSKPRKRWLAPTGLVLAGALMLTACGGTSSAGEAADASAIVVAAPGIPSSWAHDSGAASASKYDFLLSTQAFLVRNPYVASDDPETLIQDLYAFEGDLAERYEVSDDGLTYTFFLREGVKSAAGNELTVDDVLWSYERKFATPTSSVSWVSRPVITDPAKQFKKIDDHTLSISIKSAGYGFTLLSLLSNSTAAIFDSDLLKEHATDEDPYAVKWSDTTPTSNYGFGPYMVESADADTTMVLAANPNYYGTAPEITKITYKTIPDAATRAAALKNGDVQVATSLRPADTADLAAADSVHVPDNSWSNQFLMAPLVTNKAPFDDVKVRQAFAYAVPYDQIIDSVYRGRASKPESYLDRKFPSYDASGLPSHTYDPAKAKALLEEAGHPDGVSFTLTYATGTPDVADAAIQIQSAAAEAGFEVKLEELPIASFTQGRAEGAYQAMLHRDNSIVMAPSYEMLLFTGKGSTTNYSKWEDEKFYDAVDAAIDAGDPMTPEAGALWNKAENIFLTDSPIVLISQPKAAWSVADNLSGPTFRTDSVLDYRVMDAE